VALNTPENQKFLKVYQQMLRTREPDSIAVCSYDAGKVISKRAASTVKRNTHRSERGRDKEVKGKTVGSFIGEVGN
jgi:ABC-type branched-subunit amino acid transport system substrate-binding protein